MNRPDYQALDKHGLEYLRPARVIGELPWASRAAALTEATASIAAKTGLKPIHDIHFGVPAFTAFEGMTRAKAKHHQDCELLLTKGDDVSLDYCGSYDKEVAR